MTEPANRRAKSSPPVAPFSVRSYDDADTRTIALCGELDLATAHALERELKDAEAANARVIVLDLRTLEFIDSSGIHVIFKAHRRATAQLLLVRGPERVQRPFELCGLLEVLTFLDDIPAPKPTTTATDAPADTTDQSTSRRAATTRRTNHAGLASAA